MKKRMLRCLAMLMMVIMTMTSVSLETFAEATVPIAEEEYVEPAAEEIVSEITEKPAEEEEAKPEAEADEQPAEAEAQPEAEANEQPAEEAEVQPEAEADEQPAEEAEVKPEAEADEQPEEEAEAQPEAEADEQPAEEAEVQPEAEADEQPAEDAEVQPEAEADEQPAEGAVIQPEVEADEQQTSEELDAIGVMRALIDDIMAKYVAAFLRSVNPALTEEESFIQATEQLTKEEIEEILFSMIDQAELKAALFEDIEKVEEAKKALTDTQIKNIFRFHHNFDAFIKAVKAVFGVDIYGEMEEGKEETAAPENDAADAGDEIEALEAESTEPEEEPVSEEPIIEPIEEAVEELIVEATPEEPVVEPNEEPVMEPADGDSDENAGSAPVFEFDGYKTFDDFGISSASTFSLRRSSPSNTYLNPQTIRPTSSYYGRQWICNRRGYPYPFTASFVLDEDYMPQNSVYIAIANYDCDEIGNYNSCEYDQVYINGNCVGVLTGNNQTSNTTLLKVDRSYLKAGTNNITIRVGIKIKEGGVRYWGDKLGTIYADDPYSQWWLRVDDIQILCDGGSEEGKPDVFKVNLTKAELSYSTVKCYVTTQIEDKKNRTFQLEYALYDWSDEKSPTYGQIIDDDFATIYKGNYKHQGSLTMPANSLSGTYTAVVYLKAQEYGTTTTFAYDEESFEYVTGVVPAFDIQNFTVTPSTYEWSSEPVKLYAAADIDVNAGLSNLYFYISDAIRTPAYVDSKGHVTGTLVLTENGFYTVELHYTKGGKNYKKTTTVEVNNILTPLPAPVLNVSGDINVFDGETVFIKWNQVQNATAYSIIVWDFTGLPLNATNAPEVDRVNDQKSLSYSYTFRKAGTYVIGVYSRCPGSTKYCQSKAPGAVNVYVTVDPTRPAKKIYLDQTETITLNVSQTKQLTYYFDVPSATVSGIKWKTSSSSVAKVSADGLVTALKSGKATITVSMPNGAKDTVSVKVVDNYKPSSVTLDQSGTVTLEMGSTLKLNYTLSPSNSMTILKWSSSSSTIAKVDENGVVTPLKEGTVTITLSTHNSKKDTVKVKVVDPYKPTSVKLMDAVKLSLNNTLQLHATLEPATAKSTLTWSSSNKRYATVDANGLVTPLKEGSVTITVKTHNGKKDTVKITIYDPLKPLSVELAETGTVELSLHSQLQLHATVEPSTAKTSLTWSSSSKSYATVDKYGLVTPVKEGTATITVKTDNGKTDTVKVKVVDPYKPASVELLETGTVKLDLYSTLQLHTSLTPATAKATFTWSSSNKKYATVNSNGLVTPVKEGTATITVKTQNGKTDTVKVTVYDPHKPTKIELRETGTVNLSLYDTFQLHTSLEPSTAKATLTWTSSNKSYATVDQYGVVTPVKEGTVTITVKTHNGKTDTVKVKVIDQFKPTAVVLKETGTVTVAMGTKLQLHAALEPSTAKATLTWSSSSKSYATVDKYGIVTPVKEGTATITVKTHNGKTDTVKIKVVDPHKPTAVELKETGTVTVAMGTKLQLHATLQPSTAKSTLTWSSSNKSYATVDEYGIVTPVKEGTVTITVKTHNGKTDTVKIKVTDQYKPTAVVLQENGTVILPMNNRLQLHASLVPSTAQATLTWSSSDVRYAVVDQNGLVTPLKEGTVTITVKTHNGFTDTVKVKIIEASVPQDPKPVGALSFVGYSDGITTDIDVSKLANGLTVSWNAANAVSYTYKAILINHAPTNTNNDSLTAVRTLYNDKDGRTSLYFTKNDLTAGLYLKIAVQAHGADGSKSNHPWIAFKLTDKSQAMPVVINGYNNGEVRKINLNSLGSDLKISWYAENAVKYAYKAILLNEKPTGEDKESLKAIKVFKEGTDGTTSITIPKSELQEGKYVKFAVAAYGSNGKDSGWVWIGLQIVDNAYYGSEAVAARMDELYTMLGGPGFFTVNGKSCTSSFVKGHACSNCFNENVLNAAWFKSKFGTVSCSWFPTSYDSTSEYTQKGWSCLGFAHFAEYWLYRNPTSPSSKVSTKKIGTYDFNQENAMQYAQTGDVIRFGTTHSAICYYSDSNGMYVLDCNWGMDGKQCRVDKHYISYSKYETFTISRAYNAE